MKAKPWARYGIEIQALSEDDGGGYLATFNELAHVITGLGETREEAMADLQASLGVLENSLHANGEEFPPAQVKPMWSDFSGRITLRLPKSLHRQLDQQATEEGVSLNSYLMTILQAGATAYAAGEYYDRFKVGADQEADSAYGQSPAYTTTGYSVVPDQESRPMRGPELMNKVDWLRLEA